MKMQQLVQVYKDISSEIEKRYDEFGATWDGGDETIFKEMVFCLCTPQTKAQAGWKAATALFESGLVYTASEEKIAEILSSSGVRYKNKKAKYILEAKARFSPRAGFSLQTFIETMVSDHGEVWVRNWFAEKVKGWGLKEASHFLRNIGVATEICILDRHILRELVEYSVIESFKKFDKKEYWAVEAEMIKFAKELKIPVFALDFVFWAETHNGEIFK